MPFAETCSTLITAACYPPYGGVDASLGTIKWGAIEQKDTDTAQDESWEKIFTGHCTSTNFDVTALIEGRMYQ
jgi:hypothetical protein